MHYMYKMYSLYFFCKHICYVTFNLIGRNSVCLDFWQVVYFILYYILFW